MGSIVSNKINTLYIRCLRFILIKILITKTTQKILYFKLSKTNRLIWEISILVDKFSLLFRLTVLIISYAVFNFSYRYISNQKFFSRFHILLFIFVLSIVLLIFSSNLIFIILGWDGLGLSSYLLVIYYGRAKAFNSGILTVIRNRCGDFMLIACMSMLYSKGSWDFMYYKELTFSSNLFFILLLIGAFTKRAQVPFSAWLPAAIAAPTPVSSLVHSSTLVTAGVYLLFRHLNRMVIMKASLIIYFIGIATILLASVAALNEKDMKKIVALSTLSQLGLIIVSLRSGWFFIAFFHLITHAYFKAIIFIRVGNIIHHSQDYQVMKNTGRILYPSPMISSVIFLASISLSGAPFTAAFFSKEPIIEILSVSQNSIGTLICLILRVFLTIMYSSRLIKIVTLQFNRLLPRLFLKESDYLLNKGIFTLYIPSFISGMLIFNFSISIPHRFYYPEVEKIIILSLLFMILYILMKKIFIVASVGSYYVFTIWSLANISSSLFNYMRLSLSQTVKTSGFRFYLNVILKVTSQYKSNLGIFIRTYFIYRCLSVVIVLLLSFALLI